MNIYSLEKFERMRIVLVAAYCKSCCHLQGFFRGQVIL